MPFFRIRTTIYCLVFLFALSGCKKEDAPSTNDSSEEFPGGATTIKGVFSSLFEQPSANLNSEDLEKHNDGDANFESNFVTSPAIVNAGLGPVFNHLSCISCHARNGKSPQPFSGADLKGLLIRISIPGADVHGGPLEVPGFGGQLQQKAVSGAVPEASVQITFEETTHYFADGIPYTLRKPIYSIQNPYMTFPANAMLSPRIGQTVIGLGLLEAITEVDILTREDIMDADGDGISGKANRVWDPVAQQMALGRFGWKAGAPSLLVQAAAALHQDMGITSWIFPQESSAGQTQADGLSDDPEVDSTFLENVTFYTQSLAVPARRNFNDADVLRGKELFFKIGCDKCHRQKFVTGTVTNTFLSNQLIYPYTDMLLHDMGDGLADNRPDFKADGKEWRTPPLWGIGLTPLINGHTNFLHDGRARSLIEAIMWHGGEAESQKLKVQQLNKKEREQLVKFVGSL